MRKIKIFLSSSEALKNDRQQFEIFIYRRCKALFEQGLFLHLDFREDFIDTLSIAGLQHEYNKAIKSYDIFIFLTYNKADAFAMEEFSAAFGRFVEIKKPFLFAYFKKPINVQSVEDEKSIRAFQDKLNKLNHYYTEYHNITELCEHFGNQLVKLVETDLLLIDKPSNEDRNRLIVQRIQAGDSIALAAKQKNNNNLLLDNLNAGGEINIDIQQK